LLRIYEWKGNLAKKKLLLIVELYKDKTRGLEKESDSKSD